MKAGIIGSGVSGLATAACLAKAGWDVTVFEAADHAGGVTALAEQDGFRFEQGPLLMGDFLPGEKIGNFLESLGIRLELVRGDRGTVMPDFALWHPDEYAGPYWRRDRLKELFPASAKGLDRYYRFTEDLLRVARLAEQPRKTAKEKVEFLLYYLRVKPYFALDAQELMDRFFAEPRLQAVFLGILADFCASPKEFAGVGVPFVNLETAFERRIPLEEHGKKIRNGFCYVKGSIAKLVEAFEKVLSDHGGTLRLSSPVEKVLTEEGKVKGLRLASGEVFPCEVVVASGGAKEFFTRVLGEEYLTPEYKKTVDDLLPMESVFMVHLGIDEDPLLHQKEALCYYYGTPDIEGAIARLRSGKYHGGDDGFLAYCPSWHSPELAPAGCHCLTLYTVCPDTLADGDWETSKEAWADRLVALAETKFFPGLSAHVKTRLVKTPLDYRKMTLTDHSSFGGTVPDRNRKTPAHVTPVKNLYFVGSQSETQGGVSGCLQGAKKVVRLLGVSFPEWEEGKDLHGKR